MDLISKSQMDEHVKAALEACDGSDSDIIQRTIVNT